MSDHVFSISLKAAITKQRRKATQAHKFYAACPDQNTAYAMELRDWSELQHQLLRVLENYKRPGAAPGEGT